MSDIKGSELKAANENMLEISQERRKDKEEDRDTHHKNQMASLNADLARHEESATKNTSKRDYPAGFEDRYFTKDGARATTVYADSKGEQELFKDTGDKLKSNNASNLAVKAMMETAKHRNWEKITVRGSEEYRREAWLEGQARNIDVKGYKPNELDMQELKQREKRLSDLELAPEKRGTGQEDQATHERGETRAGMPETDAKEEPKREAVEAAVERSMRNQYPDSPEHVEKGMNAVRKSLDERAERGEKLPDLKVKETHQVEIGKDDKQVAQDRNASPQDISMDQLKQNVKRQEQDKDMEKAR